jgi:hypothetical protein
VPESNNELHVNNATAIEELSASKDNASYNKHPQAVQQRQLEVEPLSKCSVSAVDSINFAGDGFVATLLALAL